jgi:hypothetical protein
VIVGGEDHDRTGKADYRDHRNCEERTQVSVVGAEDDGGVLCGEWLGHGRHRAGPQLQRSDASVTRL